VADQLAADRPGMSLGEGDLPHDPGARRARRI
jgi:hypothetical protein